MTIATDPVDRAEIDSAGGNSAALPLAQAINGWSGGDFLEHDKLNAVIRNAAQWKEWLDQTRVDTSQVGYTTSRLSTFPFAYAAGAGLVDRVVGADSTYIILGKYVALTLARLLRYQPAIHTYTFTASMTHHFYVDAGGVIVVSVVALGTPAAPGVGFVTLVSIDTDATDITAQTVDPLFTSAIVRHTKPHEFVAAVSILSTLLIDGGDLTIDKTAAGTRQIIFSVDDSTALGWRITHSTTERLRIQEMIGGIATTIFDLGAPGSPGSPANFTRPVLIDSDQNSLGDPALKVQTNFSGAPGLHVVTAGAPSATFEATAYAATAVLVPTISTAFSGVHPRGSIRVRNDANSELEYKDNSDVSRKVWASDGGMRPDGIYTLANSNNIGVGTVIQTFNYTFIAGQRYLIKMGCRVGRFTGSTRDAQFTCTVGGVALAYSGQTVLLWQGGGATELEQRFEDEAFFVSAGGGSLAVSLLVTPVNGAGSVNVGARSCRVLGHFQP